MKRIIDFDVSVGGLPSQIVRVEYVSHWSNREEIQKAPYSQSGDVIPEAVEALKQQIGHDDIDIQYWYWIE